MKKTKKHKRKKADSWCYSLCNTEIPWPYYDRTVENWARVTCKKCLKARP